MSTTIKDVAKLAGVSISTVSRVINDSKPVSPDARKRVLDAVEELNYKPNQIARSLVTQKSNILGVIVEDIGLSFISQVLRGVEEVARMYDYDIIVSSTYGDPDMEDHYIRLLLQKQVEGIVVISESNNENRLETTRSLRVPVMYLNRFYRNEGVSTVTISNTEATKELANYLVNKGHNKIMYLGNSVDADISVERFKIAGYRQAMEEEALEPRIIQLSENSQKAVEDVAGQIENQIRNDGLTGIICNSYEVAIDLMNALYDRGIRIPDDLSVVGIGDGDMAQTYRPRLTTISEPLYDYGAVSIRAIIKTIKGEGSMPEERVFLPSRLIERESVKDLR